MKRQNINQFHKTTDLVLSATLSYFDQPINEIVKTDTGRCLFVFQKNNKAEQIVNDFYQYKLVVEPIRFMAIQKQIKSRIYFS